MATIFITGSADGLGQLAARQLVNQGHQVVLHARNADRSKYALQKVRGAADVLIADLSSIDETKTLAAKVNALGKFGQGLREVRAILEANSVVIQAT